MRATCSQHCCIERPTKFSNTNSSVTGSPSSPSRAANTRLVINSLSTRTPSQSKITNSKRRIRAMLLVLAIAVHEQIMPNRGNASTAWVVFLRSPTRDSLMAESPEPDAPPLLAHGAEHLSLVTVETYN